MHDAQLLGVELTPKPLRLGEASSGGTALIDEAGDVLKACGHLALLRRFSACALQAARVSWRRDWHAPGSLVRLPHRTAVSPSCTASPAGTRAWRQVRGDAGRPARRRGCSWYMMVVRPASAALHDRSPGGAGVGGAASVAFLPRGARRRYRLPNTARSALY
jgi:hypothetical protein